MSMAIYSCMKMLNLNVLTRNLDDFNININA